MSTVSGAGAAGDARRQVSQTQQEQEKKKQEELQQEIKEMEQIIQQYEIRTEDARENTEDQSQGDKGSVTEKGEVSGGKLHDALHNLHAALLDIQSGYLSQDVGGTSARDMGAASVQGEAVTGRKKFSKELALAGMQMVLNMAQSSIQGTKGVDGAHQASKNIQVETLQTQLQKSLGEKKSKGVSQAAGILAYDIHPSAKGSWAIFLNQHALVQHNIKHLSMAEKNFEVASHNYQLHPSEKAFQNIEKSWGNLSEGLKSARKHLVGQQASAMHMAALAYFGTQALLREAGKGETPSKRAVDRVAQLMVDTTSMRAMTNQHMRKLDTIAASANEEHKAVLETHKKQQEEETSDATGAASGAAAGAAGVGSLFGDAFVSAPTPAATHEGGGHHDWSLGAIPVSLGAASLLVIEAMAHSSLATTQSSEHEAKLQQGATTLQTDLQGSLNKKLKGMHKYIAKLQTYAAQLEKYSANTGGMLSDLGDIAKLGAGLALVGPLLPLALPICLIAGGIDAAVHHNSSDWGKPFEWIGNNLFKQPAEGLGDAFQGKNPGGSDPSGYIDKTQAQMNVANTEFKVQSTQIQAISQMIQGFGTSMQQGATDINTNVSISQQVINLVGSQWSKVTGGINA